MTPLIKQSVLLLAYLAITCLLLFPLPFHLSEGLLAAESGDPLMQVWVVQWNIHKLSTSLTHYFDANIFYPYPNTFAYHDHMFMLGVLGFPIFALSQNPLFTYNVLLMLSFVLSAYGMYLLCKELTGSDYAAMLAGLIFGFLPYRFAHLDHLNLLSIQWLPFCVLFLTRFLTMRNRSSRKIRSTLILFWTAVLLQVLTSFNYLFMLVLTLAIYTGTLLALQWRSRFGIQAFRTKRDIFLALGGGCVVALLLLPFALPYLRANREMGFQRSIHEAEQLSAQPHHYLAAPADNWLYGGFTRRFQATESPFPNEQILFYGMIPSGLAVAGCFAGRRKRRCLSTSENVKYSLLPIAFLLLAGTAWLLSLGPAIKLFGQRLPLPYALLYHYLPGFKAMRVPARFGMIVFFALTVLAALGMAATFRRMHTTPGTCLLLVGLVGGLIVMEYASFPQNITPYPGALEGIPAAHRWLAQHGKGEPVIELPGLNPKANFETTYYSTFHWSPMLNGRSAFIPDGIHRVFETMRDFPSADTVALLQSLGIRYVILHENADMPEWPDPLPGGLEQITSFEHASLFSIAPGDTAEAVQATYHFPLALRPDESYTLGIALQAQGSGAFCPLPHDKAELIVSWEASKQATEHIHQTIPLPLLISSEKPIILPVMLRTPAHPGDYRLTLALDHPDIAQASAVKPLTLVPNLPDSRIPEKLYAEFLAVDIPKRGIAGEPLSANVLVKNSGGALWKARVADQAHPAGEVHLGVTGWHDAESGKAWHNGSPELLLSRGYLNYAVAPGQEIWITLDLATPQQPGKYMLEVNMVSELIQWFDNPPLQRTIFLE